MSSHQVQDFALESAECSMRLGLFCTSPVLTAAATQCIGPCTAYKIQGYELVNDGKHSNSLDLI